MREPLTYLSRLCLRWGGELTMLSEQAFQAFNYRDPGISEAPDGWACDRHPAATRDRRRGPCLSGMCRP
jgi:hypothetical protein